MQRAYTSVYPSVALQFTPRQIACWWLPSHFLSRNISIISGQLVYSVHGFIMGIPAFGPVIALSPTEQPCSLTGSRPYRLIMRLTSLRFQYEQDDGHSIHMNDDDACAIVHNCSNVRSKGFIVLWCARMISHPFSCSLTTRIHGEPPVHGIEANRSDFLEAQPLAASHLPSTELASNDSVMRITLQP